MSTRGTELTVTGAGVAARSGAPSATTVTEPAAGASTVPLASSSTFACSDSVRAVPVGTSPTLQTIVRPSIFETGATPSVRQVAGRRVHDIPSGSVCEIVTLRPMLLPAASSLTLNSIW